jgi:RimJ/RimL family protein N-acetyltransferase
MTLSRPTPQPSLESKRLILRPFHVADAPAVQRLAGERDIADTTRNIPHPYADGMAEAWIQSHEPGYEDGTVATFAIIPRDNPDLVGAIGLQIDQDLGMAELGYWIGKPFWNLGYATEAAIAILAFGFNDLRLNRIQAGHLARNPTSGRVMEKAGMVLEGKTRQATIKRGQREDLVYYGILREDWLSSDRPQGGDSQ